MSTKVTYLASRSLAVYETTLIERFAENYQRTQRLQAMTAGAICFGFLLLAGLVLLVPIIVQDAVRYLFF